MPFSVSAFSIVPFVQRIVYLSFILRSKQYSAGRGLAVFSGGSESEVWVLYSMVDYGFDEDKWFLMCEWLGRGWRRGVGTFFCFLCWWLVWLAGVLSPYVDEIEKERQSIIL